MTDTRLAARAKESWDGCSAAGYFGKALAALGLIERIDYQAVPPQVEYTLTSVGNSLLPIIAQMAQWGTQYLLRDPVFPTDEE